MKMMLWLLTKARSIVFEQLLYRVFSFKVRISAPRLYLGYKSQQILTLARARSIWDFQPLDTKARAKSFDFPDALDVKPVL
jgi:hypothetical protein